MPATSTPRSGSTSRSRPGPGGRILLGPCASAHSRPARSPSCSRTSRVRPGSSRTSGTAAYAEAPRAAQRHPPGGVRAARRHRTRNAGRFLPRAVHRGARRARGSRRGAARAARGHVARRCGSPRPDGPPLRARARSAATTTWASTSIGRRGSRRRRTAGRCSCRMRRGRSWRATSRRAWSCCPSASTSCATSLGRNRSTRSSARVFRPSSRRSSRLVARAVATSRPA